MRYKRISVKCTQCGKTRLVNTSGMLASSYEKRSPKCHKCAYSKELSGKTTFKKNDVRLMGNTFSVGLVPWNKNTTGLVKPNITSFKKGDNIGESNNRWKGDSVGYQNLHSWLRRSLKKVGACKNCEIEGKTEWANISREYKRDFDDFVELCRKCHSRYDHNLIQLNHA